MAYIGNSAANQTFTPIIDTFNGNGSTTAFTLTYPVASVAQVEAYISNVPQQPGVAYTVLGNTITFTSAPPSGTANIYVRYTSPITQIMQPGQGTVGTSQMMDAAVTAAKIAGTTITPDKLTVGAISWDSSGRVTMPYQPAFWVTGITSTIEGSQYLIGNTIQTNIGNNFSSSTKRFTAPIAGTYFISGRVSTDDSNNHWLDIAKNGSSVNGFAIIYRTQDTASYSVVITLAAGDYITARSRFGSVIYGADFCGHLIG